MVIDVFATEILPIHTHLLTQLLLDSIQVIYPIYYIT